MISDKGQKVFRILLIITLFILGQSTYAQYSGFPTQVVIYTYKKSYDKSNLDMHGINSDYVRLRYQNRVISTWGPFTEEIRGLLNEMRSGIETKQFKLLNKVGRTNLSTIFMVIDIYHHGFEGSILIFQDGSWTLDFTEDDEYQLYEENMKLSCELRRTVRQYYTIGLGCK